MIPKFIIIVPYRDRKQHKHFFERQINHVLEDIDVNHYEIYFLIRAILNPLIAEQ